MFESIKTKYREFKEKRRVLKFFKRFRHIYIDYISVPNLENWEEVELLWVNPKLQDLIPEEFSSPGNLSLTDVNRFLWYIHLGVRDPLIIVNVKHINKSDLQQQLDDQELTRLILDKINEDQKLDKYKLLNVETSNSFLESRIFLVENSNSAALFEKIR